MVRKREGLIKRFLSDDGFDFPEQLTQIIDEYIVSIFEKGLSAKKLMNSGHPFALIALGGLGRREQCIHSDIDLLILFEKTVPKEVKAFIQELVYPLWDARFQVGYAVRNIDECLHLAFERFDILTTVLDARLICGLPGIYISFLKKFRSMLYSGYMKSTLNYLYEYGEQRHSDYGDSAQLISPDLKSGFGGLRDYHTLLWYAKIKSNIKKRRDLEYYGFLSPLEYTTLEQSLKDIWRIRNFLHFITKRRCDILHFEYQAELADLIGYRHKKGHTDVETFLGDLHNRMDFLKQIHHISLEDILYGFRRTMAGSRPKSIKTYGLVIIKKRLYFKNTVVILQKPDLLIKIFFESAKRKIPLSIAARRIVSEFLHLIDDEFIKNRNTVKIFKKIIALSSQKFNVLDIMLITGILGKLIPEFTAIINKIQYNHYHLFPVDRHSILCVQIVNDFKKPADSKISAFYSSVFKEIKDKKLLLFTGLLHDIGKSSPEKEHLKSGAKIAKTILERFGFSPPEIRDAAFLIENHLIFIQTATRRDIADEETAIYMAKKVVKPRLLRMLFLLTVADSQATGPKAWNEWTANLLKDLFLKTLGILKNGELASKKAQHLVEKKKKRVLRFFSKRGRAEETMPLLEVMSQRYLFHTHFRNIIDHINVYKELGNKQFTWQILKEGDADYRNVIICRKSIPGFYSKIAGVFFLNGIDIIGSQIYPFGETHMLDLYTVKPPKDRVFEAEKWKKAEADLIQALGEDHFLDKALSKIPKILNVPSGQKPEPNKVRIDNELSSFFTIVEVLTYNFPGLLFSVTNALYRSGVKVDVAMVATKVDQVIDIFYVRSIETYNKIETEQRLEQIKIAILKSLPQIQARR
ncbi:MAG: [protein-PII] uridylyltransferase [Desulfobacula sp.]|nr:[protein-PII] uridylyltransferase [Desulfobacula sp.]